jgi:hypothetical protein
MIDAVVNEESAEGDAAEQEWDVHWLPPEVDPAALTGSGVLQKNWIPAETSGWSSNRVLCGRFFFAVWMAETSPALRFLIYKSSDSLTQIRSSELIGRKARKLKKTGSGGHQDEQSGREGSIADGDLCQFAFTSFAEAPQATEAANNPAGKF